MNFFRPNAQLRPIVEGTLFFCARGTGFQPVKTRPSMPRAVEGLAVLLWSVRSFVLDIYPPQADLDFKNSNLFRTCPPKADLVLRIFIRRRRIVLSDN